MTAYITVTSVDRVEMSPDGFETTLVLSAEPDDLLRQVIERWKYRTVGLKRLGVAGSRLVVSTELDVEAPASALRWLYGGSDPALVQMQGKALELRSAQREALEKARSVFERPS